LGGRSSGCGRRDQPADHVRERRFVVDREDALVAVGRTHADIGEDEIETGQKA